MANLYQIKLEYDDRELRQNIRGFDRRFNNAISAVFEYNAPYATAWMKTHAPWHDDTGAARASLFALANSHGSHHEMLLSHGVTYGIWLEVANNRRYEILASTQRHMGSKIMSDLDTAFRDAI